MVEHPLEVVEDGEQLAQEFLVRILGPIGELLPGPPLVVFEVGSEPLVLGKRRPRLIASRLQLRIDWLFRLEARIRIDG